MTSLGELGELGEPRGPLGGNTRTPQPGGGAVFPIGRRLVGSGLRFRPRKPHGLNALPQSISAELQTSRAALSASGMGNLFPASPTELGVPLEFVLSCKALREKMPLLPTSQRLGMTVAKCEKVR
jgi:hypothetical protein